MNCFALNQGHISVQKEYDRTAGSSGKKEYEQDSIGSMIYL